MPRCEICGEPEYACRCADANEAANESLAFAIDLALSALQEADRHRTGHRNEHTGWHDDELCDAYQILHAFKHARYGQ